MADTMTPSALKTPILSSLGDLTGMRAGVPIKGSDVVNRALDQLGVTDADDRVRGARNANWLATQVLRRDGLLGEGDKRGYWSLTPAGVQALTGEVPSTPVAVATASDLTLDELLAEDEPTPPPVVLVVPPTPPTVSIWADDTAGVALYPSIPTDTYANDAYIKSLAIGNTACFGGYDATAPVCGGCPLSGSCLSHQILRLSSIAASLRKRDLDNEAKANRIANTASMVSDPTRVPQRVDEDLDDLIKDLEQHHPPTSPPPPASTGGVKMTAQVESRCFVCRATISKGSTVFHVPNSGVRHETCQ